MIDDYLTYVLYVEPLWFYLFYRFMRGVIEDE